MNFLEGNFDLNFENTVYVPSDLAISLLGVFSYMYERASIIALFFLFLQQKHETN